MAEMRAFGDSVTEGTGSDDPWSVNGYVAKLGALLGATITNYAHGGHTVPAQMPYVLGSVIGEGDLSIVNLGINDQRMNGVNPAAQEAFRNGLRDIINHLSSHSALVFVANIIRPYPSYAWGGSLANIQAYNADIAQLVAEARAAGRNVYLVDLFSALNDSTDLHPADGLHPSQQGHDKIAQAFYSAIIAATTLPPGVTLAPASIWKGSDGQLYGGVDQAHLHRIFSQPLAPVEGPPPPPPPPPPSGSCVVIDPATGTAVGNMTQNGGITAPFAPFTQSYTGNRPFGQAAGGPIGAAGNIGKMYAEPIIPCKVEVWRADGSGTIHWMTGSNSDTITIKVFGKAGAYDGTDGDELATASFTNGASSPASQVLNIETGNSYTTIWAEVSSSAYGGGYVVVSAMRISALIGD